MTTPFDQIAPAYADLWTNTPQGRAQREQVWKEIDPLFRPGDRVLDLGCGTGDDALHLESLGAEVLGIDGSAAMVEIAQSRGITARHLTIETLALLEGPFAGILSNFGALNCVEDLRPVARDLARLLPTEAPLAICVLSRFFWLETFEALRQGDLKRATRRWPGVADWRGLKIYYRSGREIEQAFSPFFRPVQQVPIGEGDHHLYTFRRQPS